MEKKKMNRAILKPSMIQEKGIRSTDTLKKPAQYQREQIYAGRKKFWTLSAVVPPSQQDYTITKNIDGGAVFHCKEIEGSFETIYDYAGNIIDDGINRMRMKIVDAGTDYQFTDNYIPADILLTPGRVKSPSALNNNTTVGAFLPADPSYPIYAPLSFQYDFTDKLEVTVSNDSNVAQRITIVFVGYESRKAKVRM